MMHLDEKWQLKFNWEKINKGVFPKFNRPIYNHILIQTNKQG